MHALVTGASAGIGEALAVAFAREGYALTLVARRKAELDRVAASLPAGATARVVAADLGDLEALAGLVADAEKALGPLDLLVNNAGVQIVAPTDEVASEDAERLLRLNVMVPFRLTRLVLPGMIARRRGAIVDIASLSAIAPTPGMYHYSASKAAIAAASESLRAEVKRHGVHVVTVYPGPVHTAMAQAAVARYDKDPTGALPIGTTDALARLVVRAVKRRAPRVIYPRSYALARAFPGITRWVMDAFSPLPKRLDAASAAETPAASGTEPRS